MGISTGRYKEFVDEIAGLCQHNNGGYICIANVHMLIEAHEDPAFAAIVNNAEIATPDGKPITWMLKRLYGEPQDRVAGMDLFPDLLKKCEAERLSVFFYGSTSVLMEKVHSITAERYPRLKSHGYLVPPMGEIGERLLNNHVKTINKKKPDIVFVILGCPRQEKLMAAITGRVNSLLIGIGGALNVFAGDRKRAPKWMQNCSLEWLFRLIQEPRRLWKRYLYTNTKFIFLALKQLISPRISKNEN